MSSKFAQGCNTYDQEKIQNRDLKNREFGGKQKMWVVNPLTFRTKIE